MDNAETLQQIVSLMDDFNANLTKLNRKVDRLTTLTTKIAKTLHLLPVTEKEERELQITQRKNLQLAADVSAQLDAMANVGDPILQNLNMPELFDISKAELFSEALASDMYDASKEA